MTSHSRNIQEGPRYRVTTTQVEENRSQNGILRQVPAYPVQTLTYPGRPDHQLCETGGQGGVQPTGSVIDPDSDAEFKDVLIRVQEQPTGSLIFGVGVNSDAGLIGTVILKERNDAARPK
jgi:hypothetical protein